MYENALTRKSTDGVTKSGIARTNIIIVLRRRFRYSVTEIVLRTPSSRPYQLTC